MSDNSDGKDTTMAMAQTCSTCKWALWKRLSHYWYFGSGKKQMGMCLVWCEGEIPEQPKRPRDFWGPGWDWLSDMVRKEKRLVEKDEYLGIVGEQVVKRLYERVAAEKQSYEDAGEWYDTQMKLVERWREEGRNFTHYITEYTREAWVERKRQEWIEWRDKIRPAVLETTSEYAPTLYDAWRANYDWWQENWPRCRRCHRNTTCRAWKEAPGRREPYARNIAKGNGVGAYALNNGSKKERSVLPTDKEEVGWGTR